MFCKKSHFLLRNPQNCVTLPDKTQTQPYGYKEQCNDRAPEAFDQACEPLE